MLRQVILRFFTHCIFAVALLLPTAAVSEPITLKLAFFSSDRTHIYRAAIKPFVDAVNAQGQGKVQIEIHLSGSLGQYPIKQSKMLRDGKADIAFVVQPYETKEFPDSTVIEMPGLFKNAREASLAFSHMASNGLMRGFDDFVILGAYAGEPESLHMRPPVASLADLKGKRVRTNNKIETAIFKKLDISPKFIPLTTTALAISAGEVDGAAAPPVPMIEFGIGRVTPYHYMLGTSCVPFSLLMTKQRFERLPADVQALIRKYSGEWLTDQYIRVNATSTELVMNQLKSEPRRHVVFPSQADLKIAYGIFDAIVSAYTGGSPHNAELVKAAKAEVARIRSRE
jgi:TRAP-type C4-dicarboxylate transport system substrate-binding protein